MNDDIQSPLSAEIQSRISAAADHLTSMGQKPTQTAVRAHLGSGSMRDISRGLAVWHAGRADVDQQATSSLIEAQSHTRQIIDLIAGQADEIDRLTSETRLAVESRDRAIRDAIEARYQAQRATEKAESVLASGSALEQRITRLTQSIAVHDRATQRRIAALERRIESISLRTGH